MSNCGECGEAPCIGRQHGVRQRLQACIDDPMSADYAQVSKSLLRYVLAELRSRCAPKHAAGEHMNAASLSSTRQVSAAATCQHQRYTVDKAEQVGKCLDCGAEGRMTLVVGDPLATERERLCAAIKAADDKAIDEAGYMLDSSDCISVIRGIWHR